MPTAKIIPKRILYQDKDKDFSIISCSVVEGDIPTHPQYHSITIKGNGMVDFKLDRRISCVLEPIYDEAHPHTYKFIGFEAFSLTKLDKRTELQSLRFLMTNRQAESCHEAYPHFVEMVLNGHEADIDYHKIDYVGPRLLEKYIKKIKKAQLKVKFLSVASPWGIETDEALDKIAAKYGSVDDFVDAIEAHPYLVIMDDIDWSFTRADKAVLRKNPTMTCSYDRAEAACLYLLDRNEQMGNTRINASRLFNQFMEVAPESASYIYEAVTANERIYYEPERKYVSLKSTYLAECHIADVVKKKIANPHYYPMDWQKFTSVDGLNLTDEQSKILELACKQDVMMLTGSAGCVDCDTEFFTGTEWKRIADYQDGDMVMEYEPNNSRGIMVRPQAYIKKPCDTLWHMETKYGVDMTVCDEHRIIYWSPKGYQHECTIQDIIDKQEGNGWTGQFATSFGYSGAGIDLTDEQIRVMCAVICDGSFSSRVPSSNRCRFHIKKDRKKERLRELFNEADIEYTEVQSAAEGYKDFYIQAPIRTKIFDDMWYQCNSHQLQVICNEIIFWDGSVNISKGGVERKRFSANVKENADFVQFAFTACGYRASISSRDRSGQKYFTCGKWYTRKSVEYDVTITSRNMIGICCDNRPSHKKTMPVQVPTKDGYKYCFTVPSRMLVLRRNGNIFITGNCGKTAATTAVVQMLEANHYSYTLLAPTGIATKRMREATGREASTIHMRLMSEEPLGDYVLIDEMGMVSVTLLSALFNKLNDRTKLIFIADPSQLASISCGNVVRDMLDSGIMPVANLTKVFRYNTSGIITIATDVRNGLNDHLTTTYPDYKFIQIDTLPIKQIEREYARLLASGYKQDEILILSPFNKGDCGSLAINNYIQAQFNTNPETGVGWMMNGVDVKFRIGDKVINKKNEYHMPLVDSKETVFVANGDIGRVVDIDDDKDEPSMVVRYDCGDCLVDKAHIGKTLLAYSISVHSCQGSQAKAVIVVCDRSHRHMISKNLVYTAVSRAQKELVLIGDIDTISEGIKYSEEKNRETYLCELLKEDND